MSGRVGLARLLEALDGLAAGGRQVLLWWRDDDLERPTPALADLLAALGEHGIAPGLAAVCGRLTGSAVAAAAPARLLPHGWLHADHAGGASRNRGGKKSEYGPERPAAVRLAEIAAAWARLAELAGDRALPCFVPPWNRLGDDLLGRLGEAGMAAMSAFAPAGRPPPAAALPRLDTHVDLMDWRAGRRPLPAAVAAAVLADRIAALHRHETLVDGPIGILSHHLVTDATAWREWRPWLAVLSGHPAVRWLDPAAALAAVGAARETRRTG